MVDLLEAVLDHMERHRPWYIANSMNVIGMIALVTGGGAYALFAMCVSNAAWAVMASREEASEPMMPVAFGAGE